MLPNMPMVTALQLSLKGCSQVFTCSADDPYICTTGFTHLSHQVGRSLGTQRCHVFRLIRLVTAGRRLKAGGFDKVGQVLSTLRLQSNKALALAKELLHLQRRARSAL